jgi:hypothetical protein
MTETRTAPRPMIFAVLLDNGMVFQIGQSVPGSDDVGAVANQPETRGKQALKVLAMFEEDDGAILVYCAPVPGSPFDQQSTSIIERLYPRTIRHTLTVARNDVFKDLLLAEQSDQRCDGCSTLNDSDANFCKKCGEGLGEEEDEPETSPALSPPPQITANGGA